MQCKFKDFLKKFLFNELEKLSIECKREFFTEKNSQNFLRVRMRLRSIATRLDDQNIVVGQKFRSQNSQNFYCWDR